MTTRELRGLKSVLRRQTWTGSKPMPQALAKMQPCFSPPSNKVIGALHRNYSSYFQMAGRRPSASRAKSLRTDGKISRMLRMVRILTNSIQPKTVTDMENVITLITPAPLVDAFPLVLLSSIVDAVALHRNKFKVLRLPLHRNT